MKTKEDLEGAALKELIIKEVCKSAPDYKYLYLKLKFYIDVRRKGQSLFKAASIATGRTVAQIKSKSQKSEDVLGRALVYFELKSQQGITFQEIGRTLDRDHVSVMNSYYNVKHGLEADVEYYTKPYKIFCRYLGK